MTSRRHFLRGAGIALALPHLPSLSRRAFARERPPETPRRLVAYFVPNGMHMPAWTPTGTGRDFVLSPTLEPLAPWKQDILVLSGLVHQPADYKAGGDHAVGTAAFLTDHMPAQRAVRLAVSMDQVAAKRLGRHTPLRSLQLGIGGDRTPAACDDGYSCVYANNVSWANETTPLPPVTDPRIAFDLLVAGGDAGAGARAAARRRTQRLGVLDTVAAQARDLERRLGVHDRQKLDEWLYGVRELERRITRPARAACAAPVRPASGRPQLAEHIDLMSELIVWAFRCDATRVVSFMLGGGASDRSYGVIGAAGNHHAISHHQKQEPNYDKLKTINRFEIERFAGLLRRLAQAEDVDGRSILANTTVFLSSDVSDGDRHNHDNMPVLLAGQLGGRVVTGRHVVYDGQARVAQMFVSLLRALDSGVARFGTTGTAPLEEVG